MNDKKNKNYILLIIKIVILTSIAYYYVVHSKYHINKEQSLDIINLFITFSSITVGFIGTLLGLILSISNSPLLEKIGDTNHYREYIESLEFNIYIGLIIILLSFILYILIHINSELSLYYNIFNLFMITTVYLFLIHLRYILRSTKLIIKLILNKDAKSTHNKGIDLDPDKK